MEYTQSRDYLWKYFEGHAAQRLTTFNFYLVVSSAIITGYFVALRDIPLLAIMLGGMLILFSLVFWKLDMRTKFMIHTVEDALKYIELHDQINPEDDTSEITKIFHYEEKLTNHINKGKFIFSPKRMWSYSNCFNAIFMIFSIFGFIGFIVGIIVCLIS